MLARSTRRGVAILGLLALCLPAGARPVLSATPQCSGRHDVSFASPADSASSATVAMIACTTSRLRGLTARTPIAVRLVDSTTLRAEVAQIGQQEADTEPLTGTAIALQLLGALGTHQDLAAIRRGQYNLDTAAEYDYHAKTLFVRAENGHFSPLDQAVIAHEYTRALQDQYYNLSALLAPTGPTGRNSDALLARQAVVEGDAINTMLNVATATFSHQELLTLNKQLQGPANSPSDFPHDLYGFPAAQGTTFVKNLMQAAAKGKRGDAAQAAGNAAIDQALANPPTTTLEVLNLSLYLRRSRPRDPVPPLPDVSLGPGWVYVDSDVLGSFGINDLLNDHAAQAAGQAAAQWQSDRWATYERGADTLMIWRARFSDAAGAQAFSRAMVSYVAARFHASLSPQATLDWHTTGYAMSLRQMGATAAIAIGSNKDLQPLCAHAVTLIDGP